MVFFVKLTPPQFASNICIFYQMSFRDSCFKICTVASVAHTMTIVARTVTSLARTVSKPSPSISLPLPPGSSSAFTRRSRQAKLSYLESHFSKKCVKHRRPNVSWTLVASMMTTDTVQPFRYQMGHFFLIHVIRVKQQKRTQRAIKKCPFCFVLSFQVGLRTHSGTNYGANYRSSPWMIDDSCIRDVARNIKVIYNFACGPWNNFFQHV